jgi:cold shock protein
VSSARAISRIGGTVYWQTLSSQPNTICAGLKKIVHCTTILLPIQLMMDNKTTGTVKFFNADKGFGFIKHDDSNKETFVHASGLIDQIKENDHVEFDLQNGKKGLNAVNVKLIR